MFVVFIIALDSLDVRTHYMLVFKRNFFFLLHLEFGEPGQIDNAIVNEEYDSCEEIRQTNQEYTNLQAVACFFQTSDLRRNNVHEPNAQKY